MSAQKSSRVDLLEKKVAALISVVQRILDENAHIKDLAVGTLSVVKLMPDYEAAIEALKVEVENVRGVLALISSQIAQNDCNIESVTYDDTKETGHNIMVFIVSVIDIKILTKLVNKLKKNEHVLNVERKKS